MAIEAERLLAIFEAKFDSLDKALAKSKANASAAFGGIQAEGTSLEASLAKIGSKGAPGFDRMAKAAQGAKVQTGNLAAQLNDIGVQLAGGQSPFLIALQQGTQIQQALGSAGAKGAVSALGGAFASLVNPVGLATIATIALGGVVVQYFSSLFEGGEKSAEVLQREAELIQRVASKWGDALPELQKYAAERQRLAEAGEIKDANTKTRDQKVAEISAQLADATAILQDFNDRLEKLGGNEKTVNDLRQAFGNLDDKARDLKATSQDYQVVVDLMNAAMKDASHQGGQQLLDILIKLQSQADQTRDSLAKMDAQAAGAELLRRAGDRPSTTGGPARYQPGMIDLPGSAPTPDSAPNREDMLAEIDRRNAAAARRASRPQRLSADDRIGEDIQAIKDRTAALEQEASMIGLSFEEQQKRKVALDLEQTALKQLREEALKKGQTDVSQIQLSAQQVASINAVAEAYAAEAQHLKEAREQQALQRDILEGAFSDLRSALEDGKLDWKDLGDIAIDALDRIIDKIENDLIDAILQANGAAGGGGGILGTLLGAIGLGGSSGGGGSIPWAEDTFRARGGPVQAGKAYIVGEKRPELFVPGQSGMIHPSVPDVRNGGAAGGDFHVSFSPVIQMTGGQGDAGEQVTKALKAFEKEFLPRTVKAIRQAKTLGMLA